MGKFEKKEKIGPKAVHILRKHLCILAVCLIGLAVIELLGLDDWLESTNNVKFEADAIWAAGIVIIVVACEMFSAIRTAIRKKKNTENGHCPPMSS